MTIFQVFVYLQKSLSYLCISHKVKYNLFIKTLKSKYSYSFYSKLLIYFYYSLFYISIIKSISLVRNNVKNEYLYYR
jgi:hypothetical protein